MEYPRKIKIENAKLKKLIDEKGVLVTEGRALSEEIESLDREMHELDEQIKQLEKSVNIEEFHVKEKEIADRVDQCIKEMKEVQQQIFAKMKEHIPDEFGKEYDALKEKKEKLEERRNKIALKAQKYNDKIIPLGRKAMQPFLEDRFDDYDTIRVEDGEVVCTIFNHLEDFKNNFNKK